MYTSGNKYSVVTFAKTITFGIGKNGGKFYVVPIFINFIKCYQMFY